MQSTHANKLLLQTLAITLLAVTNSACSDNRSAFEVFVECNDGIVNAEKLSKAMSCYTSDQQDLLRAYADDDDQWFRWFQASRQDIVRLHEEQSLGSPDSLALLVVGRSRNGIPTKIEVQMDRERGRWRIANDGGIQPATSEAQAGDAPPPIISMQPDNGAPWYPGELRAWFRERPEGSCQLRLAHVFQFPSVMITADCTMLTTPGSYTLRELAGPSGEITASTPVEFYDHRQIWFGQILDGLLTISVSDNGSISGDFRFDAAGNSDQLTVIGTFSNIRYDIGE